MGREGGKRTLPRNQVRGSVSAAYIKFFLIATPTQTATQTNVAPRHSAAIIAGGLVMIFSFRFQMYQKQIYHTKRVKILHFQVGVKGKNR